MAPQDRPAPDQAPAQPDNRSRLTAAMIAVVAEKGYDQVTIADVVAHARVSRRTFYEHFPDKQACLLACEEQLRGLIQEAIGSVPLDTEPRVAITTAVEVFLAALMANPALAYTHFVAMYSAGPQARRARAQVQVLIASTLREIAIRARRADPALAVPSELLLIATIGGIGELIAQWAEQGRIDQLGELAPTVIEFATRLLL